MLTIKNRIAAARDRGATPLEILAGLVLLGIIFGFLIVKFFGWRENTQDKGAQTTLRNALLAAESVYQQENDYIGSNDDEIDALTGINPEITFSDATVPTTVTAANKDPNTVYVVVAPGGTPFSGSTGNIDAGQGIQLFAISQAGNTFCISSIADSPTLGDIGTYYDGVGEPAAPNSCDPAVGVRDNGFPGV